MKSYEFVKKFRATFTNSAFHRASAKAVGDLCWLIGNKGVRAGAPFMAHNTLTATFPSSWVLSFLLSIPGCLQSSCFSCAETQLFHKPWGNLPIQIRQVQRRLLKVLSWGSASVKPGSLKLAFGYGCSQHRITYEVRNSSVSTGRGFATLTFFKEKIFLLFFQRQTFPKLWTQELAKY